MILPEPHILNGTDIGVQVIAQITRFQQLLKPYSLRAIEIPVEPVGGKSVCFDFPVVVPFSIPQDLILAHDYLRLAERGLP